MTQFPGRHSQRGGRRVRPAARRSPASRCSCPFVTRLFLPATSTLGASGPAPPVNTSRRSAVWKVLDGVPRSRPRGPPFACVAFSGPRGSLGVAQVGRLGTVPNRWPGLVESSVLAAAYWTGSKSSTDNTDSPFARLLAVRPARLPEAVFSSQSPPLAQAGSQAWRCRAGLLPELVLVVQVN